MKRKNFNRNVVARRKVAMNNLFKKLDNPDLSESDILRINNEISILKKRL